MFCCTNLEEMATAIMLIYIHTTPSLHCPYQQQDRSCMSVSTLDVFEPQHVCEFRSVLRELKGQCTIMYLDSRQVTATQSIFCLSFFPTFASNRNANHYEAAYIGALLKMESMSQNRGRKMYGTDLTFNL